MKVFDTIVLQNLGRQNFSKENIELHCNSLEQMRSVLQN